MAASASTAVLARTVMILRMMVDLPFFFWLSIVRSSLRCVTHLGVKTSVALEYIYTPGPGGKLPLKSGIGLGPLIAVRIECVELFLARGRKRIEEVFFAEDEGVRVVGGNLKGVAVGDGIAGAGLDAVAAKNAAVVVDVVNLGVTFRGADPSLGRVLGGLNVDAVRWTRRRAQEAGHAFFKPVFIAPQDVDSPVSVFKVHRLVGIVLRHRGSQHGLEKCVACFLCAAACPANCIYIEAAENTAEHRISAAERYAKVYNIDYNRCIFCGYCVEACPCDAITHGQGFEIAAYDTNALVWRKEQLLEPAPAPPEPHDRPPRVLSNQVPNQGLPRR